MTTSMFLLLLFIFPLFSFFFFCFDSPLATPFYFITVPTCRGLFSYRLSLRDLFVFPFHPSFYIDFPIKCRRSLIFCVLFFFLWKFQQNFYPLDTLYSITNFYLDVIILHNNFHQSYL